MAWQRRERSLRVPYTLHPTTAGKAQRKTWRKRWSFTLKFKLEGPEKVAREEKCTCVCCSSGLDNGSKLNKSSSACSSGCMRASLNFWSTININCILSTTVAAVKTITVLSFISGPVPDCAARSPLFENVQSCWQVRVLYLSVALKLGGIFIPQ